ncbi:MAG: 2-oxo acid dehydrogenase subunit E2 [Candidatus Lokiarchaeota archaeon]|nr:2-oxo acid dehydrogenase subunit E2 [Candidatus Lokiarchaeota archaeon]
MELNNNNEDFLVKKIPKTHKLIFDMFDLSLQRHHIHVIAQIDIDLVLKLLEQSKEIYGEKISLTGYLIYVFSRVIEKYNDVHAIRVGLKKYIFYDVDVHTIIEREVKDGEKAPTSYIIRQANRKSILEIHNEIRNAQKQSIEGLVEHGTRRQKLQKLFSSFPKFLRKKIFKKMLKKPRMMKKNIGTVCVTAVGMLTKDVRTIGMPIPIQPWPIQFSLGCLDKRLRKENGQIIEREFLNVTITLDHDVIQGGTITRFLNEIYQMVESGFGLK